MFFIYVYRDGEMVEEGVVVCFGVLQLQNVKKENILV